MATTPRGISYEEIAPPTFAVGRDSITATRTLKIAWADIDNFLLEHFPPAVVSSGGNINQKTLRFPGKPYLYIFNVDITPFDDEFASTADANGVATCPSGAIAKLEYKTSDLEEGGSSDNPDGNPDAEVVYSASISIGGEYLQLPAHALKWDGDAEGVANQTEDLNAAKLIPAIEYVVTLHRVPELPLDAIINKIGRVNELYENNFRAEPETLLFLGCNANRNVTVTGAEAWEIEMRFSCRRVIWFREVDPDIPGDVSGYETATWNHFMDPKTGKWRRLKVKNGDSIYNTTENFDALFFPDADPEFSSSQSVGYFEWLRQKKGFFGGNGAGAGF